MKTENVRTDSQEDEIVEKLNRLLANQFLLRSKMRNYRWNFQETHQRDLDRILKDHGLELDRMIEEVVHVIQKHQGSVAGSLTEILEGADLLEDASAVSISAHEAVTDLAEGHQKISQRLVQKSEALARQIPELTELGEQFLQWSRRHHEMHVTLKAIARDRLHLQ